MATCVVACKLPSGIQVRLGEAFQKDGEGKDAQMVATTTPKVVHLRGSNARDGDGMAATVGGYGFTTIDNPEGMTDWLKRHADLPAVRNGSIFMEANMNAAKGKAREMSGEASGFERMDYEDPMGDGTVKPAKTLEQTKADAAEQAGQR